MGRSRTGCFSFARGVQGDDRVAARVRQSGCARKGSSWRSCFRGGRISLGGEAASRGGTECQRGQARKGVKGLALTSPGRRVRGCACGYGHMHARSGIQATAVGRNGGGVAMATTRHRWRATLTAQRKESGDQAKAGR
jgi:hypothetical protein